MYLECFNSNGDRKRPVEIFRDDLSMNKHNLSVRPTLIAVAVTIVLAWSLILVATTSSLVITRHNAMAQSAETRAIVVNASSTGTPNLMTASTTANNSLI